MLLGGHKKAVVYRGLIVFLKSWKLRKMPRDRYENNILCLPKRNL
jgi:hypothetical protein